MSDINYAFQGYDEKTMAKAIGRSLAISTKKSVELANMLRGKSLKRAKVILEQVAALKTPVPYKRYNQELAHQTAIGPGGYPVKVAEAVLKLIKSVEANAVSKGLNAEKLKIVHICAHLASRPFHYGRKRRVKAKRTHVEVVVQEAELPKKKEAKKPAKKAAEPKAEAPKTETPKKDVEAKAEKKAEVAEPKVEAPAETSESQNPATDVAEDKKDDNQ